MLALPLRLPRLIGVEHWPGRGWTCSIAFRGHRQPTCAQLSAAWAFDREQCFDGWHSTRDTPERRSAGPKSMKPSSCAAFGLAVKPPAEFATAGCGPCYAKSTDVADPKALSLRRSDLVANALGGHFALKLRE